MFTEFTVFLFAILEPLHQASKHKAPTSIPTLIKMTEKGNVTLKNGCYYIVINKIIVILVNITDKGIVTYNKWFITVVCNKRYCTHNKEELLLTMTMCYTKQELLEFKMSCLIFNPTELR